MPKKASDSSTKKATKKSSGKDTKSKKTAKQTAAKTAKKTASKKTSAPKEAGASTKASDAEAPKPKAATKKAPAPGKLRVTQVRSGIGHAQKYKRTLRALGLKHHQQHVVVADTPSMRGMLFKVRHLVQVTTEEA